MTYDLSPSLRSHPPIPFHRSWNLERGLILGSYHKRSLEPACSLLFLMNGSNPKLFSLVFPNTPRVPSFPQGTSSPSPTFLFWDGKGAAGFLERTHPAAVGAVGMLRGYI